MPKDIALSGSDVAQEWIFVPKPANVDAMSENLSYRRSRAEMNRSDVAPTRRRKGARVALGILIGAGVPYLIAAVQHGLFLGGDLANLGAYAFAMLFGAVFGGLFASQGASFEPTNEFFDDVDRARRDRQLGWGVYTDHSKYMDDLR